MIVESNTEDEIPEKNDNESEMDPINELCRLQYMIHDT